MPPKGGNAKKESGRAKKAENEANKKAQATAVAEHAEAAKWDDGSKKANKKDQEREEKRAAELARKAETARLLAEEEAAAKAKVPKAPKAGAKKAAPKPAGPGAIAAGGGLGGASDQGKEPEEPEAYTATGIDNALDLLDVVTSKTDKASVGQQAAGLERHPERRFKAALEAYKERELPNLKVEHPGLRLRQYEELLFKQFQKSPENPFNQATVDYNASKVEKVDALNAKKSAVEERLRERS